MSYVDLLCFLFSTAIDKSSGALFSYPWVFVLTCGSELDSNLPSLMVLRKQNL